MTTYVYSCEDQKSRKEEYTPKPKITLPAPKDDPKIFPAALAAIDTILSPHNYFTKEPYFTHIVHRKTVTITSLDIKKISERCAPIPTQLDLIRVPQLVYEKRPTKIILQYSNLENEKQLGQTTIHYGFIETELYKLILSDGSESVFDLPEECKTSPYRILRLPRLKNESLKLESID